MIVMQISQKTKSLWPEIHTWGWLLVMAFNNINIKNIKTAWDNKTNNKCKHK